MSVDVTRRSLFKWSGAVAGAGALVEASSQLVSRAVAGDGAPEAEKTVWSACLVNCGSRCPLRVQVADGVVIRVQPDNSGSDELGNQQVRACVRGRAIRQRLYNPDRLKSPLKRKDGTKRGEGQWEEISWDAALDLMAAELHRVITEYGNEAVYFQYYSGVEGGNFTQAGTFKKLLKEIGGYLDFYGTYSAAQMAQAIPAHYGTFAWSNSFDDALNTNLLVLWSDNSLETRMSGGGWTYILQQVRKQRGTRVIVVDPRYSETAANLSDQWIPIRPGTDAALVAGMVHVMVEEGLHDQDFLDQYCSGFDEDHMPEGAPANGSYLSYIQGKGPDGIEKTPEWAARITGVPAETIRSFAREVATTKPVAIAQGWGVQRHTNGETACRAPMLLANVTGNVGISGGGTGAMAGNYGLGLVWFDDLTPNPVEVAIPCFMWTDAIERGAEMTMRVDGIRGADKLKHPIKFMLNYASDTTVNQHADVNRTLKVLQDESLCEFIVGVDNHMTPSMKMVDLILPETTWLEREDFIQGTRGGDMGYLMHPQPVLDEPIYDCRDGYDIASDLARRLEKLDERYAGLEQRFTEGRTAAEWVGHLIDATRENTPELPSKEQLAADGIFRKKAPRPTFAYTDFRDDPEANKLDSPSGKIEIFSSANYAASQQFDTEDPIPALPEYVREVEGAEDALEPGAPYPLQMIGHHFKGRVHSTYANIAWMTDAHRHCVWINTLDAEQRGIANDDEVYVFNDRGRIKVPAKVTPRICPGVVSVPQGAWYDPADDGVDVGGNVNTLTSWRPSPIVRGTGQHTALVQIEKG